LPVGKGGLALRRSVAHGSRKSAVVIIPLTRGAAHEIRPSAKDKIHGKQTSHQVA
jgi:hypothetical protein